MRSLIALTFCCLLASLHVHACQGPDQEYTLFFESTPNLQPGVDVIAKVSLSNVKDGTATATIKQVLKTSDARVHKGSKIAMKYQYTSCGPYHGYDKEGTIIARIGADSAGRMVLYPYRRRRYGGDRIGSAEGESFKFQPEAACSFPNLRLPSDFAVFAAGAYSGREIPFQIDRGGQQGTQIDVTVNSPHKPVVLMLGARMPTIWNIEWSEGTKILAVLVSGYHRQAVAGLEKHVLQLNSSFYNRGPCGYFYVDVNSGQFRMVGGYFYEMDEMAKHVFGRTVDKIFPAEKGQVVIGEPLQLGTRLITSPEVTPESFYDREALMAGPAGLEEAVRKGFLRKSTDADADAWVTAVTKNSPPQNVPSAAGKNIPKPPGPPKRGAYVVLKSFTYPTGLYGGYSADFIIPKGIPQPDGNPGHSTIYDFNTLTCQGSAEGCPFTKEWPQ